MRRAEPGQRPRPPARHLAPRGPAPSARHAIAPLGTGRAGEIAALQRLADASPRVTQLAALGRLSVSSDGTVLQRQESLSDKIIRLLAKRKIAISATEAGAYAKALQEADPNTPVQVAGRHRALKMNSRGVVSSVTFRPPSSAANMRVSGYFGPTTEADSSMISEGRQPITGQPITQDATIDARTLNDIPERSSLGSVMGGSAAALSEIANSEWLHIIAHSLGGKDDPANVVAGSHALNTAMIPFEVAVRTLARLGKIVDYSVTFFADEIEGRDPPLLYVHHVEITMAADGGETKSWMLEASRDNPGEFINGHVLNEIEAIAKRLLG